MQRFLFSLTLFLIFSLSEFSCSNLIPEKPQSISLGAFTFDVPAGWKISRSADTMFLDSENVRIRVFTGLRLNLMMLNLSCSDKIYASLDPNRKNAGEKDELHLPSSYYPDSVPALISGIHVSVSVDSFFRKYVCYPDTGNNFPAELLVVREPNENSILFQLTKGERSRDGKSVFELAKKSITFHPDPNFPLLLAFSDHDTAFVNHHPPKDSSWYYEPDISIHGNILEVRGSVFFHPVFSEMHGLISVSNDSIFLKTVGADWMIIFSKSANLFIHAPTYKTLQCGDCGTSRSVYFKIQLPEKTFPYKIIFEQKGVVDTDNIKDKMWR
jgi:hypothetical protein